MLNHGEVFGSFCTIIELKTVFCTVSKVYPHGDWNSVYIAQITIQVSLSLLYHAWV